MSASEDKASFSFTDAESFNPLNLIFEFNEFLRKITIPLWLCLYYF